MKVLEKCLLKQIKKTILKGSAFIMTYNNNNDENKNIIIYSVIEDSPAQKAGLKPGDIIIKIDDKDFTNKETTALTSYVQNNKNEK